MLLSAVGVGGGPATLPLASLGPCGRSGFISCIAAPANLVLSGGSCRDVFSGKLVVTKSKEASEEVRLLRMAEAASTADEVVAEAVSTLDEIVAEVGSTGEVVAKAASTVDEVMAKAASTAEEVLAKAASTADKVVAHASSTEDEVMAEAASTVDEVMAKAASSTVDEVVAEAAPTVDEVVAEAASTADEVTAIAASSTADELVAKAASTADKILAGTSSTADVWPNDATSATPGNAAGGPWPQLGDDGKRNLLRGEPATRGDATRGDDGKRNAPPRGEGENWNVRGPAAAAADLVEAMGVMGTTANARAVRTLRRPGEGGGGARGVRPAETGDGNANARWWPSSAPRVSASGAAVAVLLEGVRAPEEKKLFVEAAGPAPPFHGLSGPRDGDGGGREGGEAHPPPAPRLWRGLLAQTVSRERRAVTRRPKSRRLRSDAAASRRSRPRKSVTSASAGAASSSGEPWPLPSSIPGLRR